MEELPTLFIKPPNHTTDIIGAAKAIFEALGIADWEERESFNYPPNGHYAIAYGSNITVKVSDTDDDRLEEFPVTVSFGRPTYRKGIETISEISSEISAFLVSGGFRVFIPIGQWWLTDWDRQGIVQEAEQDATPNP
jgi:hypothetical protein